jgi:glutathione S-transferase
MIELWQAEWCPYSHRVRLRLTELGVPFVARQVPLDRARRDELEAATGLRSIPTLVDGDAVVHGADDIIHHLEAAHPEPDGARRHAAQMAAEWPHWRRLHDRGDEAGT